MTRSATAAAVAIAVLGVAGCGSSKSDDKSTAAKPPSTAPATAKVPPELLGSYTRKVTQADIDRTQRKRSEVGPNQEKPKPSRALAFFEAGGLSTRDPAGEFVVQQDYSASADGKLEIRGYQHPEVGAFCGPEIAQNATYAWKASGSTLTLKAIDDPCADRDSTLSGVWKRK